METFTQFHINFMKAVAIIRQKPSDSCTARHFTERLQAQFAQRQVDWMEQVQKLSQELLRMRQKMCLYEASERQTLELDTQASSEDFHSFVDVFGSVDLLTPLAELKHNIAFLQNASHLLKQDSSLIGYSHEAAVTLKESLIKSIKLFCEYPMDQPLNQSPLIEEVSDKLVELITTFLKVESFKSDIIEAADQLNTMLLERLCHSSHDSDVSLIQSLLLQLSSVELGHQQIVQFLTLQVEKSVKDLINLKQNYFMDVSRINTLGHVLRVLETIFTKYDHPVPLQVIESLENSLKLSVTSQLSLVGVTIWRLCLSLKNR